LASKAQPDPELVVDDASPVAPRWPHHPQRASPFRSTTKMVRGKLDTTTSVVVVLGMLPTPASTHRLRDLSQKASKGIAQSDSITAESPAGFRQSQAGKSPTSKQHLDRAWSPSGRGMVAVKDTRPSPASHHPRPTNTLVRLELG
jgi:hypothetical protein